MKIRYCEFTSHAIPGDRIVGITDIPKLTEYISEQDTLAVCQKCYEELIGGNFNFKVNNEN